MLDLKHLNIIPLNVWTKPWHPQPNDKTRTAGSSQRARTFHMWNLTKSSNLWQSSFSPRSQYADMTDPFQASDRKLAAMRKQSTPVELLMEAIRCEKSRNSLRKTSGPPPRPLGQYIPRTTLSVEINCPQWRSSLLILFYAYLFMSASPWLLSHKISDEILQ